MSSWVWGQKIQKEVKSTVLDHIEPCLRGNSDQDPDPDWLRLHGGKLDSNPDLDHVDCDPCRFESGC